MVRALSKTSTGKMSAPQILSERRKELKIPQGTRRDENSREQRESEISERVVDRFAVRYYEQSAIAIPNPHGNTYMKRATFTGNERLIPSSH